MNAWSVTNTETLHPATWTRLVRPRAAKPPQLRMFNPTRAMLTAAAHRALGLGPHRGRCLDCYVAVELDGSGRYSLVRADATADGAVRLTGQRWCSLGVIAPALQSASFPL